jgi:hypothetical protein
VYREKISSFVDFPLNGLDIRPFCRPLEGQGQEEEGGEEGDERYMYDLVAVCNHYGRMGFGHYTAFAREWDGSEWGLGYAVLCCAVRCCVVLGRVCCAVLYAGLFSLFLLFLNVQPMLLCAMTRGAAMTTR